MKFVLSDGDSLLFSTLGAMYFLKLKGIPCFLYKMEEKPYYFIAAHSDDQHNDKKAYLIQNIDDSVIDELSNRKTKDYYILSDTNFGETIQVTSIFSSDCRIYEYYIHKCIGFDSSDDFRFRTDPCLIKTVEDLGPLASEYCQFHIVDAPEGITMYLGGQYEYGSEELHEQHRIISPCGYWAHENEEYTKTQFNGYIDGMNLFDINTIIQNTKGGELIGNN